MSWPAPILTDAGGYKVFSLDPQITEEGAVFKSSYDGAPVKLTREKAIAVQESPGADIAMALDVLVGLPASHEIVEQAMHRTLRWSDRALAARTRPDQAVFGIVQGGSNPTLRAWSAAETATRGFDGFGIGGLWVGESGAERAVALDAVAGELPEDRARYVMGVGDTEGPLDAIGRDIDLFDCVLPTRLGRHGKTLHPDGDFSIKRAEWAAVDGPIDTECGCPTCLRYSRGNLRHLFVTRETLGPRLMTMHNLWYTLRLVADARSAIAAGKYRRFRDQRLARRSG